MILHALLLLTLPLSAAPEILPDTLDLRTCYESAQANFPLARQAATHEEIARTSIADLDAEILPSVSLNAQATYHSEVPSIPLEIPGAALPDVRHDQYRVALEVGQLIYDGGRRAAHRGVERATAEAASSSIPVQFHQIRARINEAYFGAMLQEAAAASLDVLRQDLEARRHALQAQLDAGLVSEGSIDVLDVEIMALDQQLAETYHRRRAALDVLEELTGLNLPDHVVLDVPAAPVDTTLEAKRPELRAFNSRSNELDRRKSLAAAQFRPQISSFASAAYGRPPGLNMFENEMSPFFTAGLTFRWPLWDRGTARRRRQILSLQQELIESERDAFLQGVDAEAARAWQEIERLRDLAASDREILDRRGRIADRAAEQLESGVISATDYLLERHAEEQARLAAQKHRIELAFAQVQYLTILGRTDEIR